MNILLGQQILPPTPLLVLSNFFISVVTLLGNVLRNGRVESYFSLLENFQTYFNNIMAALVYISLIAKDDKYFLRLFLVIVNSSFENFVQIHTAFFICFTTLQLCFLFISHSYFFINSLFILDIFYQLDRWQRLVCTI